VEGRQVRGSPSVAAVACRNLLTMQPPSDINFTILWQDVTARFKCGVESIHGPSHWKRVEQNGLLLATRTGANIAVVRLFALFHDSCRVNECGDEGHGARGAELAQSLRGVLYDITDEAFALLYHACAWHTNGHLHADPTIGSCWDADRLDLGRVGILPSEEFMSTSFGKEIARVGSTYSFLKETKQGTARNWVS
jgi:uncharacterized protein